MVHTLITTTAQARDNLRLACGQTWEQPSDIGAALAHLSGAVTAIDRLLAGLGTRLLVKTEIAKLAAVDGIFEGDVAAATQAAGLWLSSASATCTRLHNCLDNANIALGGLAESAQPAKGTPPGVSAAEYARSDSPGNR